MNTTMIKSLRLIVLVEFNNNFIPDYFFVLRADPAGNSRGSSALACAENSTLRIRNMKKQGYNETKEVLTTIDAMNSLRRHLYID